MYYKNKFLKISKKGKMQKKKAIINNQIKKNAKYKITYFSTNLNHF